MKIFYTTTDIPFEYPFTISGGRTKTSQPALIVALQMGHITGYGEASAISYYNVTVEKMVEKLEQKKKMAERFAMTDPTRYWHYLHHLIPDDPFLVSALDMAGWDLFGKLHGLPLYKFWKTDWKDIPETNYTIGIDPLEKMLEKMKAHPWPGYKIKVGTAEDVSILESLRNQTDAIFRIDANAGWTLEEALKILPKLKDLKVELVEQPLPKDEWEGMKILFEKSPVPLIADESCVSEHDVIKCAGHFHGINIKLTKCSGITPALRMVSQARELGLKVMMGSMNENVIGSAAIAQFLPQLDYVDMDGPLLQTEKNATGLDFQDGAVFISNSAGLGVDVLVNDFK